MLDFTKLLNQLKNVGSDAAQANDWQAILQSLQKVFQDACNNDEQFALALQENQTNTFWPLCQSLEQIRTSHQIQPFTKPYSVVAVDGSQIMPNHHEVRGCYLINLGTTVISYGPRAMADLESSPMLFHTMDDLYPRLDKRRMHVNELFIGLERNLLELSTLKDLSLTPAVDRSLPMVAFIDGSLIQYSLDKMPETYQVNYLERLTLLLDSFQQQRIPLLGYISHSRSSDLVNALRVWHCPYEVSTCQKLCGHLQEEDYPCSSIWPSTDRQALATNLPLNHRCALFSSAVWKGPSLPDRHTVCFTYLNIGNETARIEMPRWLAQDPPLLETALQIVLSQVAKGQGYPICIAEAHNMAVIKGADRANFFQMLSSHLITLGVPRVNVSPKESGKRQGIV